MISQLFIALSRKLWLLPLSFVSFSVFAESLVVDPLRLQDPAPSAEALRLEGHILQHLRRNADELRIRVPADLMGLLETAEQAFLHLELDRAQILWQQTFDKFEKSGPLQNQQALDQRVQELAWLIWTAKAESSEALPPSAWRYRDDPSFMERLPSRARLAIEKSEPQSLSLDWDQLPQKADMLWINFESAELPTKLSAGRHHLLVLSGALFTHYALFLTEGEAPLFRKISEASIWATPKLEQALTKLPPPKPRPSRRVELVRQNQSAEVERLVVWSRPEPIVPRQRTAKPSVDLNTELARIFEEPLAEQDPTWPLLQSPWFWLGVGAVIGSATFVGIQMNRQTVVSTP